MPRLMYSWRQYRKHIDLIPLTRPEQSQPADRQAIGEDRSLQDSGFFYAFSDKATVQA